MGNRTSLKPEEEESIKTVITSLNAHEIAVEGIAHAVEAQMALVRMLSVKISKIESIKELDESRKKNDCSESIICSHCTPDWQEYANRLLGSVQSSLRCQSKSLNISLTKLCSNIRKIANYYKIEDGTSVDKSKDKFCLEYDSSPTKDYQDAYEQLRSKFDTLEKSHVKLELANAQYGEQITDEKQFREKLEEEMKNIQYRNTALERNNQNLQQQIQHTKSEINEVMAKQKAMEELRSRLKQTLTVQIFHSLKGGLIAALLYEFKTMLATQMKMKRHDVQFVLCQSEMDVDPHLPVFVFCINASRLGTDAGLAIQNLQVSSKMCILIFHHKDVHALPNQASERVLTEPEFKGLGGIFDIGFLSGKGIYACDMNLSASAGIESFLRAAES